jgi:FKBP-type peptidyl-prolyl cis-trans isomerase FkpA
MLRSIAYSVALIFVIAFASCNKEPKCEYNECSFKAPSNEIQAVKDYLAANNITATEHCSGLFYRLEKPGSGTRPNACSYVLANYKGMLTNGHVFDQSPPQGVPFEMNGVITGWTNGLQQVKEGGRIHLYIPPSLGYGSQDNGDIPAHSILIFEVDLLGVQ